MDLLHAGLAKARAGDIAAAGALIDRGLALEPRNPSVLTGRAIIYRVEGRMRDAVLACEEAIRIEPRLAGAWLERGIVLSHGGSPALARESFAQAAELAPQHADAHANLAAIDARNGAHEPARAAAATALRLDPQNLLAAVAMATVLLADGEPQQAINCLGPLVQQAGPGDNRTSALSLIGRAYEKLGNHAAAFEAFRLSKEDFAAYTADIRRERQNNRDFVETIFTGFKAVDRAKWSSPLNYDDTKPNHIYLLGYPRSGTTLVENILASIEGVAALEERPTLIETDREYLLSPVEEIPANLARFAELDSDGLARLAAAYWDKVFSAGVARNTAYFVDMDPLKGSRLPFISRLFPHARIVVMRRDPRDVVWSCFKTDFAVANATLEYISLERAALHYDAMMRLTEEARERLPLAFHELRYEALVADFEPTTKALCEFARLPWSDAVRKFATTAEHRGVATASSGQVRKGLYDGSGQWKPYAEWLEPVMPILEPWIDKFGYS